MSRARPLKFPLALEWKLRVGHLLTVLEISHQTLYTKLDSGEIPQTEGHDPRPYWHSKTIRGFLLKWRQK